MSVDESRPATWLVYNTVTTPMTTGLVVNVLDMTHMSLSSYHTSERVRCSIVRVADMSCWMDTDLLQIWSCYRSVQARKHYIFFPSLCRGDGTMSLDHAVAVRCVAKMFGAPATGCSPLYC
jgi:hypothetical protein